MFFDPIPTPLVPLVPLHGHHALRDRFRRSIDSGRFPGSILLDGPRGVGKQRLALWLGQLLLCTGEGERPCGRCQHCRYASAGTHPDLHWYFPRPRLKDSDPSTDDIRADIAEAIAARLEDHGLYAPPSGSEGIFIATIHAIVRSAAMSPALASRKVFVIGDAERMTSQEGADQAANAFLKLLEEPPENTTLILTSSESGSMLPTVRSRVVSVRVPPLDAASMKAFLADPVVKPTLRKELGALSEDEMVRMAGGAPGQLLSHEAWSASLTAARALVDAATSREPGKRAKAALGQGGAGARGKYTDILDAVTVVLHERARAAAGRDDGGAATGTAKAVEVVERAKEMASGNVNPQLITAELLRELSQLLTV